MYFDFLLPRIKEAYPDAMTSVLRFFSGASGLLLSLCTQDSRSESMKGFNVLEISYLCRGTGHAGHWLMHV